MNRRFYGVLSVAIAVLGAGPGVAVEAGEDAPATPSHVELEAALAGIDRLISAVPSPLHHRRAELLFRLGRYTEAIADYTTAARLGRPHDADSCWERGLAQYYAGDFSGGADQFTRYHQRGATDIENGIWRFLCIAEAEGLAKARETMFAYPRKRGAPFPALLALYLGPGTVEAVLEEAEGDTLPGEAHTARLFYAHYYIGKFYEIAGDVGKADVHVRKALKHPIPHFMYFCAELDAARLAARIDPSEASDHGA